MRTTGAVRRSAAAPQLGTARWSCRCVALLLLVRACPPCLLCSAVLCGKGTVVSTMATGDTEDTTPDSKSDRKHTHSTHSDHDDTNERDR